MLTQHRHVVHERSHDIPIKQNLSTHMKINSPKREYSLKQNFFDPSKSSPPNEFMIKLHMRVQKHYMDNNDVSCDDE
jgi:hypothetical protein